MVMVLCAHPLFSSVISMSAMLGEALSNLRLIVYDKQLLRKNQVIY